jgi:hypothetical protein
MTFREDDYRTGTGYAPENLSTLRKLALQITSEQNDKLSLKKQRLNAAYYKKLPVFLLLKRGDGSDRSHKIIP